MALQGWLLFAIGPRAASTPYTCRDPLRAAETLLFNALLVPALLFRVIRKTGISRVCDLRHVAVAALLLLSFACDRRQRLDHLLHRPTSTVRSGLLRRGALRPVERSGAHRHALAHLRAHGGFLTIENGVFLFSTAIGVEMPLLVNVAVLLDILMSVLMLGIFFTRIDGTLHLRPIADDAHPCKGLTPLMYIIPRRLSRSIASSAFACAACGPCTPQACSSTSCSGIRCWLPYRRRIRRPRGPLTFALRRCGHALLPVLVVVSCYAFFHSDRPTCGRAIRARCAPSSP